MTAATPPVDTRWCRANGLRELGSAQGSGLRDSRYLLRRSDGQVLQVSELLHHVLREVSPERDDRQVAAAVSVAYGRELSVEGLQRLITTRLHPLDLVQPLDTDPQAPAAVQVPRVGRPTASRPLLSLRLRRTLLPRQSVRSAARVLAPVFRPAVVTAALVGLLWADVMTVRRGSIVGALDTVLATPTFLLILLGIITAGALVHELGHAAACHYGGAEPGVIGMGLYIVFPAFFTDVTDSYRLDRVGRIRTDLGGLYFQVWCLLALDGLFLYTGNGLFLLATLLMHIEMAQQLIPTVRFDGYFILADLAGVPDLFIRVRPVLLSLVPGRAADPRVAELRPAARRLVTVWVLVVVPTLIATTVWLIHGLPFLVRHTVSAIQAQQQALTVAWQAHDPAAGILAAVSIVLLALPLLGLLVLAWQLLMTAVGSRGRVRPLRRSGSSPTNGSPVAGGPSVSANGPSVSANGPSVSANGPSVTASGPDGVGNGSSPAGGHEPGREPSHRGGLNASAFTDELMLNGPRGAEPESGWRRALYRLTRGRVNPGPSAAERRRADVHRRMTAPIDGSRRVVVLSRKGGVGKTTITLALGSTFAIERGDRVIAVDANPDAGNLAHRVAGGNARTMTDVLDDIDVIASYSQLRRYTSQSRESKLEVLASDDDPRISQALTRQAYHRVIELLDHYYNLILLDSGTGILDSANQGLLHEADQVVLVLRPAVDGARAAALTLDWLSEHGYGELVARAVVVINGVRRNSRIPPERIANHFNQRCARVVTIPWDPALETGGRTGLNSLQPATRQALVELAAAVADHFAAPDSARPNAAPLPAAGSAHEENR